jgi:thiol:disulfide interchange protein DsbC
MDNMISRELLRVLCILWIGMSVNACAGSAADAQSNKPDSSPSIEELRSVLQQRFPDVVVERIQPSPIDGLYEVLTTTEIVYTDKRGDFLVLGNVMDTRSRQNLTAQAWNAHHAVDFKALPLDAAIKTVRGDGSRVLAIFSDPDCPFCQQIEPELAKLDNVTIYTFLLPLETLHPGAKAKAKQIWCAGDKEAAWHGWMLRREAPPPIPTSCTVTPIEANLSLGEGLKISATPTMFFANGQRMSGSFPVAELEKALAQNPAPAADAASPKSTASR